MKPHSTKKCKFWTDWMLSTKFLLSYRFHLRFKLGQYNITTDSSWHLSPIIPFQFIIWLKMIATKQLQTPNRPPQVTLTAAIKSKWRNCIASNDDDNLLGWILKMQQSADQPEARTTCSHSTGRPINRQSCTPERRGKVGNGSKWTVRSTGKYSTTPRPWSLRTRSVFTFKRSLGVRSIEQAGNSFN